MALRVVAMAIFLVVIHQASGEFPRPKDFFFGTALPKWDAILRANVHNTTSDGKPTEKEGIPLNLVDYTGVKADPRFESFLKDLGNVPETNITYYAQHRELFYSFWINVYNVLAVNTIIKNPCMSDIFGTCGILKGIQDAGTIFSPIWKRDAGKVGDSVRTLDWVEDHLRNPPKGIQPPGEDSRLHACIVCASVSCPNLRWEAYWPDMIYYQMTENNQNFLNNPKKGMKYDSKKNELKLSPIYNWFAPDFETSHVKDWLVAPNNSYNGVHLVQDPHLRHLLAADVDDKIALAYFSYNWNTNGVPPTKGTKCEDHSRPCLPIWGAFFILAVILFIIIDSIVFRWRYVKAKAVPEGDPLLIQGDKPSPKKQAATYIFKLDLLLLLVIIVALAIVFRSATSSFLQSMLTWISDHKVVGGVIFAGLYVVFTIVPAPGLLLTLAAGFIFGIPLGILIVFIGAGIGMMCCFLLGRYLVRGWVEAKISKFEKFRAIDLAVKEEGWKIVALLRLAPVVPYNLLNYGLSLTSVSFAHYSLASCFGILPGTAMYIVFGSTAKNLTDVFSGGASDKSWTKWVIIGASVVFIVVLVVFITILGKRAIKKALDKQEHQINDPTDPLGSNGSKW